MHSTLAVGFNEDVILSIVALAGLALLPSGVEGNGLLEEGYRDMYNLAFDDAHRCFHEWERLHPDDPFGPVSDAAAYLFFEFDRLKVLRSEFFTEDKIFADSKKLTPDPQIRDAFEADLERSKKLADARFGQSPDDEGALFATVVRLALHSDYESLIDKQYWTALKEIKQTQVYADKLLARDPDCYDAQLAIGVENYVLSLKPAPVRWFLRIAGAQTDEEKGVAKLRLVADKGHYLKPYAKVLLAIAALRSNNKAEAKALVTELAKQFPRNDLFAAELKKLG